MKFYNETTDAANWLLPENRWVVWAPDQIMKTVEIPHIKLIVKGSAETHSNKVGCPQRKQYLWARIKEAFIFLYPHGFSRSDVWSVSL